MTGLFDTLSRTRTSDTSSNFIEHQGLLNGGSQHSVEMEETGDNMEREAEKMKGHLEDGQRIPPGRTPPHQSHPNRTATSTGWRLQDLPAQLSNTRLQDAPGLLADWIKEQRPHDAKSLLRRTLLFLLPSFLTSHLSRAHAGPAEKKLYPTSHLDGIRGVAAFFVCVYHLSYLVYHTNAYGFLDSAPGENRHWFQLPFLNLFYMGHPWVSVFFIVSGYSLSIKPLKQMRAADWEGLHQTTSSAAFRRGFRLFLPVMASTFVIMVMIDVGIYDLTSSYALSDEFLRNWRESHPPAKESWWIQFVDWYNSFCNEIWVWTFEVYGGTNYYDWHLWTIAVEFRCSLVLFLCQTAFSRMRAAMRLLGLFFVAWFAWRWGRWDVSLFLFGCILAEIDLVQIQRTTVGWHAQSKTKPEAGQPTFWMWHAAWLITFVLGLYLMSYPESFGDKSPGYIWLQSLIPEYFAIQQSRYWTAIGAVLYVGAVNNLKLLAAIFNTAPVQYLGKISYGLYLMHGPVIHSFGFMLEMITFRNLLGFTRDDVYSTSFNIAFLFDAVIILLVCVCAGDVFYRAVDIPAVRFARWLEGKCMRSTT